MAASKSTVERVLEVILKHVPKETALKILEELMTVPGNKSFRDTIERMYNRARQRSSRRSPRRPPVAPEPPATVRNTADGEEAHQGARRRHENSGFGAKPGLTRRFQEAWRRLRPRAKSTRCVKLVCWKCPAFAISPI